MSIIKDVLKNYENINPDPIESLYLSCSKSYLKILGLLYYSENTNETITPDLVLGALKDLYIFNNIELTSKPRIIKASSHFNSAIV